ncbi:AbrB/MazE/SpoVT family DNA-binding domain-containing protein [Dactylosporangium sp. NPDC005572]|uniref:AbrB/MazE/SpoVT family DNA-binding domain-containing protein n=1 Tax=Dactylosporangium sp. NPDC005572 TaxID=3156889 RepID=UPI0033B7D19C
MRYGLATLDNRGRVADGALVRAMGWMPGTRLNIREQSGLVLVIADAQGVFAITRQGYVQLPATVRHWCRLSIGERVLLSADPTKNLLVVHPPEALDAMVTHLHALRIGEDES